MFCIYDLDGCIIDSSHRKNTRLDGSLDLEHWIENNTPEKIAMDRTLPLVSLLRKNCRGGHKIVLCTARVIQNADYQWFMNNDVPFHYLLSRPEGCLMADHELKDIQLRLFAQQQSMSWKRFCSESVMYDDNQTILEHLANIGMTTRCAVELNRVMSA